MEPRALQWKLHLLWGCMMAVLFCHALLVPQCIYSTIGFSGEGKIRQNTLQWCHVKWATCEQDALFSKDWQYSRISDETGRSLVTECNFCHTKPTFDKMFFRLVRSVCLCVCGGGGGGKRGLIWPCWGEFGSEKVHHQFMTALHFACACTNCLQIATTGRYPSLDTFNPFSYQ